MNKNDIVAEEQKSLDDLLKMIKSDLLSLKDEEKYTEQKLNKIKGNVWKDIYGAFLDLMAKQKHITQKEKEAISIRGQLYNERFLFEVTQDGVTVVEEVKAGISSYTNQRGEKVIYDWNDNEVLMGFVIDKEQREYDYHLYPGDPERQEFEEKIGHSLIAHYKLIQDRKVDILFEKIKSVTQLFPLMEDTKEDLIKLAFLSELAERHFSKELKNIIFSLQKKQTEILKKRYQENLIVQGCAGSGKSMVMLHRLPVLFTKNRSIDRKGIYIISPSQTYMQMANNLLVELKLSDIRMGTLEQYFERLLGRYDVDIDILGEYDPTYILSKEQNDYFYSKKCIDDIVGLLKENIVCKMKLDPLFEQMNMACRPRKEGASYYELMSEYVISTSMLYEENRRRLEYKVSVVLEASDKIHRLYNEMVNDGRRRVVESFSKLISEYDKKIKSIDREVLNAADINDDELFDRLFSEKERVEELRTKYILIKSRAESDGCWKEIEESVDRIEKISELIYPDTFKKDSFSENKKYELASYVEKIKEECILIEGLLSLINPDYALYHKPLGNQIAGFREAASVVNCIDDALLEYQEYMSVSEEAQRIKRKHENIALDVYSAVMNKGRLDIANSKKKISYSVSLYIYLQIWYQYRQLPNRVTDKLITIDEAQGLTVEELRLIVNLNPQVRLNMYGDILQRIENSKGIDSWDQFDEVCQFSYSEMNENYRNAEQITNFCNEKLHLDMKAVNLPGSGVHEITEDSFMDTMNHIFSKPHQGGYRAIIVRDRIESQAFLGTVQKYDNKIWDMTSDARSLNESRWNMLTLDECKGLEFTTVFVVSGKMSLNEKYIAYTRALDELYVYDHMLNYIDVTVQEKKHENTERLKKKNRKRETFDIANSKLNIFFTDKGLQIIDKRDVGDCIWVIGQRERIEPIINEAMGLFPGLSGEYAVCKEAGNREAWYSDAKY